MIELKVRKIAVAAGVACLALLSLVLYPLRAKAQETRWSSPIQLSSPGAPAWFPDVVADPSGTIHVAWAGGDTEFDQVLYRRYSSDSGWSEINDLAAFPIVRGESAATRPALMADDELLHITYTNYDSVYYSNAPLLDALSAAAWQEATIVDGDQTSYFSRVVRDSRGDLHLVYTENTPQTGCQQCYHLYYMRSSDQAQSWEGPMDISISPIGAAKPQIVVGPDDVLHVVWESGYGGGLGQVRDPTQVLYASSADHGDSWTAPVVLSSENAENENARNVTIGVDGRGALLTVWANQLEQVVYYRVSRDNGRTWSQAQPVPGLFGGWTVYQQRLDDFTLAEDSAGNLHLVVVGRRLLEQTGLDLLHVVWDGNGWSTPAVVASYAEDVPEWPRLDVNLGNQLELVWFVRGAKNLNNSDAGDFSVFYAERTVDAPATSPAAITPLPGADANTSSDITDESSSAVDTPGQVDSVTPLLTVEAPKDTLRNAIFGQQITTENDEVVLLVLALTPVLLVLGAIAVYRRMHLRSERQH